MDDCVRASRTSPARALHLDMIKPPAMGVFARDPPPPGNPGVSPSAAVLASTPQLQSIASEPSASIQVPSVDPTSTPDDPALSNHDSVLHPTRQDEEAAQDDDDQGTVDEEAGIIRCICGCDDDDGFTIQCDRCLVWQHCACFGMSQASVPDEYLCEQCEPRPVDVAFAQAHQQKRKNNEARKALMDRNLKRQAQAIASSNYNQSYLAQDPASSPTSSTQPRPSAILAEDHPAALQPPPHAAPPSSRSRKPSQALDLSNTQFVVPEVPASAGGTQRGGKQRRGQKGSRKGHETPSSVSTPVRGVFTPGSSHDRLDDPFDLAEQLEAWHVEFTPITKNMIADPSALENLAVAMLDWEEGSPLKGALAHAGRVLVPVAPTPSTSTARYSTSAKLSQLEAYLPSSSASSPSSSSPHGPGSPYGLDRGPTGITAVGDECVPVELSGPSLADLACRTYVKQISESASAGVFGNVIYVNNSAEEPQRGWSASRAFSRPVMHGLFADASIPAGAFISELRGELYSATSYRNDPINQYAALGATKPHVHLFPPPLNLAIDARRFGNEARFARFSCHPNAVLRPILFHPNGQLSARSRTSSRAQSPVAAAQSTAAAAAAWNARQQRYADTPPVENRSEEPQLLFGLFALTDIPRTHEITLGWEWDDAHIVHFLPELVQNPYLESRDTDIDPSQHTANLVALAGKGEFPYADTGFSAKMSTVAAALLGCVLCACIGSAAPPGGGGGASANNGRKQDCAVAQMLRVGNGMSLLNVTMPGKTNRRAKLPDFSPLVGVRRHWRPVSLPPTPETSVKDEDSQDQATLLAGVAAEGEAETRRLLDGMDIDGEIGCGSNEAVAKRDQFQRAGAGQEVNMDVDSEIVRSDVESVASDSDDGDARSVASSLTDPLSGLSAHETLSEDEDQDLMDALRAADGVRPRRITSKAHGAGTIDAELSGLFLLPPKKRSTRTRIKAVAPSEEGGRSDQDDVDQDGDEQGPVRIPKSKRSIGAAKKAKAGAKRKDKLGAAHTAPDVPWNEGDGYFSETTPIKKRRKSGNVADPSSPLSSVPSPNSVDSTQSSPPPVRRLSTKHRLESERRTSDAEMSKKSRTAKRDRDRTAKATGSRTKESESRRLKRKEARIHRDAILDLGDTESSEHEASNHAADEDSNDQNDEDADATIGIAGSRASTPRTSREVHKSPAGTVETRKERDSTPPAAVDDRKHAKKDTPTKVKKVRRILPDSEPSSDEDGAVVPASAIRPTGSHPQGIKNEETPRIDGPTSTSMQIDVKAEPATPNLPATAHASARTSHGEDGKSPSAETADVTAPTPTAAPPSMPEVKKEEPRVKLSLAEYKRRLAERRVSEQQIANASAASAAPLTPSAATPTSEVAPSPSPTVERNDPTSSMSARPAASALSSTSSEITSTPTVTAQPVPSSTDSLENGKASASMPRGVLFTSISAPTAIRSVEIPKSPSPEPATASSGPQHSGVGQAKESSSAQVGEGPPMPSAASTDAGPLGPVAGSASSASGVANVPVAADAGNAATDTPALLMRLETRRARAPSLTQQQGVGEQTAVAEPAAAATDGFAKPQSAGTSFTPTSATAPWGATSASSASAPLRSPSLGPTRMHGGRMPPSPSGPSAFNPPKAPRAFMSPPGSTLPPPSTSTPASVVSSSASAAAVPPLASSSLAAVTSTPARMGAAASAAGISNTPSTTSSNGSSSSRYPAPGLTSPTPATTALPSYPSRNYAGVPKGPASMRDSDPRADVWAEVREAREARDARGDYSGPPRHHDAMRDGGRDMGWGERSREPPSMGEREPPMRSGWGRERRDPIHRGEVHPREGYLARDGRFFGGRDDRDVPGVGAGPGGASVGGSSSMGGDPAGAGSAPSGNNAPGAGLVGRLDPHSHHAHPHPPSHSYAYRRPSVSEYDDPTDVGGASAGGGPISPYDRASDPYNRGIVVRGRSLCMGGPSSIVAGGSTAGGGGGPAAPGGRERGEYRDYDEPSPPVPPMGGGSRGGGFRPGWGGRSRPRPGPGGGARGRGGGTWMR